jgi:hypothetical protein
MAEQDKQIAELNARIERLEAALENALKNPPNNRIAAGITARQAMRLERLEATRTEIAKSKSVRCRVERFVEGKGNSRVNQAQNIVLGPTWRDVWPSAPTELRVREDDKVETKADGTRVVVKGKPIIHTLPERVFKALQPEVVLAD